MKSVLGFLIFLATIFFSNFSAAQKPSESKDIVGLIPENSVYLQLYANAGDSNPANQIAAKDLSYPIPTLETKSGFSAVSLAGGKYWVKNSQVRRSQPSKATNSQGIQHHMPPSLSTPGIGTVGR